MERRRYERFPVLEMEIGGRMVFATEVQIVNISIGGVSLRADRRLNIGSEYNLGLIGGERRISVKGTVVWSSISGSRKGPQGETIPVYTAGMKFSDIMNEKVTELMSFIEGSNAGLENRLSGLRFSIDEKGSAFLNFPEGYKVKKISLGGMLIESLVLLEADRRLNMEVVLPGESTIKFIGRVASCNLKKKRGLEHYDIGIEFMEMSEENRLQIRDFIKLLEDRNN